MKTEVFIKNCLKFSLPTIVSAIVGVLILPLISRIYPESEYGYISNFYSIGNMLIGIVVLGLDQAYIRFFNEPLKDTTKNGMCIFGMSTGVIVTLFLAAICYLGFSKEVSLYLFNDYEFKGIRLLAVYVISLVFYRFLNINYRFSNNSKAYNIMQVGFILGNRLLFIVAAFYSVEYFLSVVIMTISTILIDVIVFIKQKYIFRSVKITKQAKYQMLRYALPAMPASILVQLNSSLAKLILGGYGHRNEVGILAIATSAANIFSIIPNAFSVYWGAYMYENYRADQERIKNVQDVITLLSIILVIFIILFQDILYMFLGENYRSSQTYFMLIMLSPISLLLSETTAYGISIARKTYWSLIISAIGCLINYSVCQFFIPLIGVYGAAAGIASSAIVILGIRTIISQKFYKSIKNNGRTIIGYLTIIGLCVSNIYLSSRMSMRLLVILVLIILVGIIYSDTIRLCLGLKKNS